MSLEKGTYLVLVIAAIVVFMYGILPKLNISDNKSKIGKAIIFLSVIVWLVVDFYLKEKYWYILFLGLGSIGFLVMLKDSQNRS
jgi:hypothetical protein